MENKQNTTAQHAILLIWKLLPAPYRYQDSNNSHGRVRQEPVSTSGAVCPERFSLSGAPPGGRRSKAFREAGVALENEFQSKLDLPPWRYRSINGPRPSVYNAPVVNGAVVGQTKVCMIKDVEEFRPKLHV